MVERTSQDYVILRIATLEDTPQNMVIPISGIRMMLHG